MIDCFVGSQFVRRIHASVLARDPVIRRDDLLRGYSAETDDRFRGAADRFHIGDKARSRLSRPLWDCGCREDDTSGYW